MWLRRLDQFCSGMDLIYSKLEPLDRLLRYRHANWNLLSGWQHIPAIWVNARLLLFTDGHVFRWSRQRLDGQSCQFTGMKLTSYFTNIQCVIISLVNNLFKLTLEWKCENKASLFSETVKQVLPRLMLPAATHCDMLKR